jgi:hypothetical protein
MDKRYFPLLTQAAEKYVSGELDLNQSIQSFTFENPSFNGTKTSISMYLEAFRNLITGKTYRRNINTGLHIFYLEHIKLNYPDFVYRISLVSTRGHLEYRFKTSGQRLQILEDYITNNSLESNHKKEVVRITQNKRNNIKHNLKSFKGISITNISFSLFVVGVFITLSLFNFLNVFRSEIQSNVNGILFLLIAVIFLLKNLRITK